MTALDDPPVSAIVLAGGRSSRYGSNKLLAPLAGSTLLGRSITAVAELAREVVVVVAPDGPLPDAGALSIRVVRDPEAYGGPLVGLLAGLEAVAEPLVIVVAGDMPSLRPEVLRLMVRRLAVDPAVSAVVLGSRGALVPLPAAIRTGAATDTARRLIADGERRLRAVYARLPTRTLEEGEWRPLDPDGETLRDVDTPADLPG